jgi:hypothetical protein
MSCDMGKITWELIQSSINKGHYPRQRKKILGDPKFLQDKYFK